MSLTFTMAAHTDVGIKKKVNQDSIFMASAETDIGPVILAAICDGMGGLSAGEMASSKMAEALGDWFEGSLAASVCRDGAMIDFEKYKTEFDYMIRRTGREIEAASPDESGTTIASLLLGAGVYYTANVGDSRVYLLRDRLLQLTKDQTVVQKELDDGLITEEDIRTHPRRSVLLQCVGASEVVYPEYTKGTYREGDAFLLCSDGFRHEITVAEFEDALFMEDDITENSMHDILVQLTEINKRREEKDNISSILIKVKEGGRF